MAASASSSHLRDPPRPSQEASASATARDTAPPGRGTAGPLTHSVSPRSQPLHAGRQVAIGVEGVRVHARDVLPARLAQADVQPARRAAARVVEHADASVRSGELEQDLPRAVLRAAVGEQQLERAVEALRLHRGDRLRM